MHYLLLGASLCLFVLSLILMRSPSRGGRSARAGDKNQSQHESYNIPKGASSLDIEIFRSQILDRALRKLAAALSAKGDEDEDVELSNALQDLAAAGGPEHVDEVEHVLRSDKWSLHTKVREQAEATLEILDRRAAES